MTSEENVCVEFKKDEFSGVKTHVGPDGWKKK